MKQRYLTSINSSYDPSVEDYIISLKILRQKKNIVKEIVPTFIWEKAIYSSIYEIQKTRRFQYQNSTLQ